MKTVSEEFVMRRDKINYYLDIAQTVAERSTCLRRRFGAVIVGNDEIVSTGYVGAPRGRKNCTDLNHCTREVLGIPKGERYELCRSVHAEANAIVSASRSSMLGSTIYLACVDGKTGELVSGTNSCAMCKRLIINAGIERVIVRDTPSAFRSVHVFNEWVLQDESLEGKRGY